jgi:hypothetical protein
MKTKSYLLIAAGLIAVMTSCRKKEGCMDTTATNFDAEAEKECDNCCTYPADTVGTLALEFEHLGNGNPFSYDSVYTDDFGNDYKFTRVQYYVSGVMLEDHVGAMSDVSEYLLVSPTTSFYDLKDVIAGHYHDLHFVVGLDSATNHGDPSNYTSGPLAFQTPSTHWSWSSGYIFIMLEGQVDSDNDGTFEGTFTFHIGTDNYKSSVAVSYNQELTNGDNHLHLNADYTNFITGIDLSTENMTHTMDNMMLANKVKANVSSVFSH